MLVKSPATTSSREADESASIQRGRSSLFEKSSQPKIEKSISNPRRNEEILTIPDGSFNLIRFCIICQQSTSVFTTKIVKWKKIKLCKWALWSYVNYKRSNKISLFNYEILYASRWRYARSIAFLQTSRLLFQWNFKRYAERSDVHQEGRRKNADSQQQFCQC